MQPDLYQCNQCGLHYKDQETAKQCEAWCGQHKSCNLDIAKSSVEYQEKGDGHE